MQRELFCGQACGMQGEHGEQFGSPQGQGQLAAVQYGHRPVTEERQRELGPVRRRPRRMGNPYEIALRQRLHQRLESVVEQDPVGAGRDGDPAGPPSVRLGRDDPACPGQQCARLAAQSGQVPHVRGPQPLVA
jgi:hypothetical protein